ncbi:hypothetical protein ACWGRJ_47390 [Bradyrhizobium sp. Lot11]
MTIQLAMPNINVGKWVGAIFADSSTAGNLHDVPDGYETGKSGTSVHDIDKIV